MKKSVIELTKDSEEDDYQFINEIYDIINNTNYSQFKEKETNFVNKIVTNESMIRIAIRSLYDSQKLRIQNGNRIVAAFRIKLNIKPSTSEEKAQKEAQKLLGILREEYYRITDGIKKVTKKIKTNSNLITSQCELLLIQAYEKQLESEFVHKKLIAIELEKYPIYTRYLKHIDGVGPLMAGVIVSELDIRKARLPSSFLSYTGIDVAKWFVCKVKEHDDAPERLEKRHTKGYITEGPAITGHDDNWFKLWKINEETNEKIYMGEYGLADMDSPGFGYGRSKRKEHLVAKQYVNKEGEIINTVGITHNPLVKAKMMEVLAGSFMKLGGSKPNKATGIIKQPCYYRTIYDSAKQYLKSLPQHKDKNGFHIEKMCKRIMIKEFLCDLWYAWRTLEGLETTPVYEVEKLGKKRFKPKYSTIGKPVLYSETGEPIFLE